MDPKGTISGRWRGFQCWKTILCQEPSTIKGADTFAPKARAALRACTHAAHICTCRLAIDLERAVKICNCSTISHTTFWFLCFLFKMFRVWRTEQCQIPKATGAWETHPPPVWVLWLQAWQKSVTPHHNLNNPCELPVASASPSSRYQLTLNPADSLATLCRSCSINHVFIGSSLEFRSLILPLATQYISGSSKARLKLWFYYIILILKIFYNFSEDRL